VKCNLLSAASPVGNSHCLIVVGTLKKAMLEGMVVSSKGIEPDDA